MKRYEVEYFNDRIRRLQDNDLLQDVYRNEMIETLNKYKRSRENGFITADEFMNIISQRIL